MTTTRALRTVLVLTVMALAGCQSDSDTSQSIFSVAIRTLDANGLDTVDFAPGQRITIEMTVSNLRNEPQTVSLPNPGSPEFCIRRAGETDCLWNSSFGLAFAQIVVPFEFGALESRDFVVFNDQTANTGMAFGAGDYEVKGSLGADVNLNRVESTWHSFTVVE